MESKWQALVVAGVFNETCVESVFDNQFFRIQRATSVMHHSRLRSALPVMDQSWQRSRQMVSFVKTLDDRQNVELSAAETCGLPGCRDDRFLPPRFDGCDDRHG